MSKRETEKWIGWHFLGADKRLRHDDEYSDGRPVVVGEWMAAQMPEGYTAPVLCESGMHASKRAIDALRYAPGPILCRVELRGELAEGTDKATAIERRVLWMADADRMLREFAIWCAEQAIETVAKLDGLTDLDRKALDAGRECNRIGRLYLDGKASAAAWGAASDAASAAAWAAAWGAAWDAARDAAWGAASDAAWNAAWAAQAKQLEEMCLALEPKEGK